jgi:beta-lactamase regulating signal transducer with metallopeptidase domain
MTALLLDILGKATALLALAALVDFALRRRASAATRHLVWSLAIAALLALPAAMAALPRWPVRIPVEPALTAVAERVATRVATRVVTRAASPAAEAALPAGESGTPASPAARTAAPAAAAAGTVALVLYAIGALLLLARIALEPFALRRVTRSAVEISDGEWRTLFDECGRRMGVRDRVRLLRSAREVMPFTFGTLTPAIVLPASSTAWNEERRRAVLLHELAHVARRDCLAQRLASLARALYWPHPGAWHAARRLRVERELACDDRVLAAGAGARDYATHLLELAHSFRAAPAPATALGMARPRQLEHRLLAILDAARNRAGLGGRGLFAGVAITIVLLVSMTVLRAVVVSPDAPPSAPSLSSAFGVFEGSQEDMTGTWELRRTQDPDVVQINIRTAQGSHGRTVRLDRLAGLPVDQIAGTNAQVHFPIRREAGTFTVDGVCRTGVCGGTYVFAPDPAFAEALAKRGIGRPTPRQQLSLAIADVGAAYLDALAAAGYAKPGIDLLVRAAQHGVSLDYVRDMAGLGYRVGTLEALIRLRDHGVDPAYVRGMSDNGIRGLSADDLVRARDHGVDPEYIRGMAENGIKGLPIDELVRTRDHGVDPEYVRGLSSLGYRGLSIDALVNARDHGVDPEYVRGMSELGYKDVPIDSLVRMRDHGVDPEFVRRLQRNGAKNLSVDELIYRRDRGIDR